MERIKWNDNKIAESIMQVTYGMNINRMPSLQEIKDFYGDSRLTNVICKHGGFLEWGKRLGLDTKKSDSVTGWQGEAYITDVLTSMGYKAERTTTSCPYDILVNGSVKIDVKTAHASWIRDNLCYSFRLSKRFQTCDIYVAVCLDDNDKPVKVYVIPSKEVSGNVQLAIGYQRSVYDKYIDKWDYMDRLLEVM